MRISYSEKIRKLIEEMGSGAVVTTDTFPANWSRIAISQVLCRLAKNGEILRVKKGVYSKVKETRFGKVKSTPLEILSKQISEDENKCFGGLFLFNNLGLTTQVPSIIEVLNNKSSYVVKLGETTVRYIRIRPQINQSTKKYIKILEVIKESNKIPDSNVEKTLDWIKEIIGKMNEKEMKTLITIALDYPPRVRAILGSIFSIKQKIDLAKKLKKTLNSNSAYRVGQIATYLENAKEWRLLDEAA